MKKAFFILSMSSLMMVNCLLSTQAKAQKPDLTLENGKFTYNPSSHEINISIDVKNIGSGDVGFSSGARVGCFLSTDTVVSSDDYPITNFGFSFGIFANSCYCGSSTGNIDLTAIQAPGGTYKVLAKADDTNKISESNENNNTFNCGTIIYNAITNNCITPTINLTGNIATASTTGSYQWLNCATNALITNATGKSYTATSNGSYKVIVTNGTCKDTSACKSITMTGIQQQTVNNELSVYPNPNNGKFIVASSDLQIKTIEIYSVLGELVLTENLTANNIVIDISEQPQGIYFYKISSENNTVKTGKLMMQ